MYWHMEGLTKTGRIVTRTVEGNLREVRNEAVFDGLDILALEPDYGLYVRSLWKRRLSARLLAAFFIDLARTQSCGLSIHESIASLQETSSERVLKAGLKTVGNSLNDGRSLKEALEASKCFPRIAIASIAAAERSGCIPEVAGVLGGYFRFGNDCRKRIVAAFIYPAAVFIALTVASIVITVHLVPALAKILPAHALDNVACRSFLVYALWMKSYWWLALFVVAVAGAVVGLTWTDYKDKTAGFLYRIPLIGVAFKDAGLAQLCLNLYVYQKSGIPVLDSITNIQQDDRSYMNEKLLAMRDKINKGASLAEAFQEDPFFPQIIWQNVSKGQKTGNVVKYLEETYRYFEQKSKDSMNMVINAVNPALLALAIAFLGFIICNFFLPIYKSMAAMNTTFR